LLLFATSFNKDVKNVGPLANAGSKTFSPFVGSSVDNVMHQTNPDFTSHFLNNSLTFLNVT